MAIFPKAIRRAEKIAGKMIQDDCGKRGQPGKVQYKEQVYQCNRTFQISYIAESSMQVSISSILQIF